VRLTQSLHPDLDISALTSVKEYRFEPGRLNGIAVPVILEVELAFTVR
jgi:hypothetical protein